MYCYECMDHIEQKVRNSYKVISRCNKIYMCNTCFEGIRFKELVQKSKLSNSEKEEMMSYKRIMDCQNKKIQEMLMKLFKLPGINICT